MTIERPIRIIGLDGREYHIRPDHGRPGMAIWSASQNEVWTPALVGEHACTMRQAEDLLERVSQP